MLPKIGFIRESRIGLFVWLIVILSLLPWQGLVGSGVGQTHPEAVSPSKGIGFNVIELAPAIHESSTVFPFTFFTRAVIVHYFGGMIVISSDTAGLVPLVVDDAVHITVFRPDGLERTIDYKPDATSNFGPLDISSYLGLGDNVVRIELIDLAGPERGGNWFYIVAPTPLLDLTPTVAPTNGNEVEVTASAPPTAMPVKRNTLIDLFGTGGDGDLVVENGQTAYSDNVRSTLATSAASGQSNVSLANVSGFAVGDEVLVIQMQGINAGSYELGTVASINNSTLSLQNNLSNTYSVERTSTAQVMRVPQYRNVTVQAKGMLTAHVWDGTTGGIVAFRARGTVNTQSNGSISVSGLGFRGGEDVVEGNTSGSPDLTSLRFGGGGGAGEDRSSTWAVGKFLGLCRGTKIRHDLELDAQTIVPEDDWLIMVIEGPRIVDGETWWDISRYELNHQSTSGTGWVSQQQADTSCVSGNGGNGGGIIMITAKTVQADGILAASGQAGSFGNGQGTDGGGAGGSILIKAGSVKITGSVIAVSGAGAARNNGGLGEAGRIHIEYGDILLGSSTPTANIYQDPTLVTFSSNNIPDDPPLGAIVVDDEDSGFKRNGLPAYWWPRTDNTFFDDKMWFTYNRSISDPQTNWATWTTPALPVSGDYTIYAYIPLENAETPSAQYRVIQADGITPVIVSQIANRGKWVKLGTYSYHAGEQGEVYLDNVISEGQALSQVKVGYDAVVWLPPRVNWSPSPTLLPYDLRWSELGWHAPGASSGNPVSTALGNFSTQHQDLFISGIGLNVDFTRRYNSLDQRVGSFGLGWKFTYNVSAIDRGNGEVIVTQADGQAKLYQSDERGGYIRPAGSFAELTRIKGQLALTEVDGRIYIFNADGTLESITDSKGNLLKFKYDTNGYTLTDTVGRTIRVNFTTEGFIHEVIDPLGRTYTYEYDGNKLVRFHDSVGDTTRYTYNNDSLLSSITDPNGHTFITNHYDQQGRIAWQKDASGSQTTFIYQDNPKVTKIVDREGHVTIHEFDDRDRLLKETDALGNSTTYEYDDDNNRINTSDPNGHTIFMTYDFRGNLLTRKDALGQVAVFQYDAQNNLTYSRDEAGAETFFDYDTNNNLTRIRRPEGNTTWMTYDSRGLPLTIRDSNQHLTEFHYDTQGNLRTVKDSLGHFTTFENDGVGRLVAKTDANGHIIRFEYDKNDRLVVVADPKGNITTFTYDHTGNLTSVTDRRGYTLFYAYNENNNLLQVTDPLSHTATFSYDQMYHRTSFTDWRGNTTRYIYDAIYNLTKTTDANGNSTTFDYDSDYNLVTITDALEQVTTYSYDALHRVVQIVAPLNALTNYTYDPIGRLTSVQDPKGGITTYAYDHLGQLRKQVDALANPTTFAYDAVGNLISVTNARNFTTQYHYDEVNRLIEQISPLGHTLRLTYDNVGNVLSITDPRGYATSFAYDPNNNLSDITDALSGHRGYTYDEEGHRLTVTDQNGHTTTLAYDPLGNLQRRTLPMEQATSFAYDENSNLTAVTNAKGKATHFTFNALNLLTSQADPLGDTTTYTYDALRQLTKVTDANGNATHYRYDALGRLAGVTDALNFSTNYEYDPLGNLTAYLDANGHRTAFDVDLLGRTKGETNPLGKTWSYNYDPVGNLVKRTDANGAVTNYTFDDDNRLINIAYPSGPGVSFSYDENNNQVGMTDLSGATTFTYDALNRLTQLQRAGGLPLLTGKTLDYAYDPASNRTQIKYPDGKTVNYAYNANDWLLSVTDPLAGITSYTYDDVGLPTHVAYPNGTWADSTYDAADRLVKLFNGKPDASTHLISSFEYSLDKVGNRLRTIQKETRGQGVTWAKDYTYDALYQLTNVVEMPDTRPYSILTSTFTYDPVGNRLSLTTNIANKPNTPSLQPLVTTNYSYNEANELLMATSPLGMGARYAYDANGNRLSMNGSTHTLNYSYDFENHLVGAKTFDLLKSKLQPDLTLDFTYDGLGRRMERGVVDNGARKTENYLYDGLSYDLLAQYVDPSSPSTTYYYRDLTQILSRYEIQGDSKGRQYFLHYDGLSNVSAWTNHNGHEVQEYTYTPYGGLIDNNGPDNSSNRTDPHNSLTFNSKLWDRATELYFFGTRDYDPITGAWLEQDPDRGGFANLMRQHSYTHKADDTFIPSNLYNATPIYTDPTGINHLANEVERKLLFKDNIPVNIKNPREIEQSFLPVQLNPHATQPPTQQNKLRISTILAPIFKVLPKTYPALPFLPPKLRQ